MTLQVSDNAPTNGSHEARESLSELAENLLRNSDDSVTLATEKLVEMVSTDHALWIACTSHLIRSACYEVISRHCHQTRRNILKSVAHDETQRGGRLIKFGKSLMDLPLPGGKRLCDATKADLIAAAEFYSKQAKQMNAMANLYTAIAGKVGRGTVGERLTEQQVMKIKQAVDLV